MKKNFIKQLQKVFPLEEQIKQLLQIIFNTFNLTILTKKEFYQVQEIKNFIIQIERKKIIIMIVI